MRKLCLLVLLSICYLSHAKQWQPQPWPTIKSYDQNHLLNIALPLGGIGTGTVSLGGRGELRDWEIMNRPAKKYSTVTIGNDAPFFAIYVKTPNQTPLTKALMGAIDETEYIHYEGRSVNHHGLPRFEEARFDGAYPFGQVTLSDRQMPISVRIKGFNPLVPTDAEASGHPVAVLTYEVTNLTDQPMEVSVCGSLRNFVGQDGSKSKTDWKGDYIPEGALKNQNEFRKEENIQGLYLYSNDVDKNDAAYGSIALTTNADSGVSYRLASRKNSWANALLDFWDDFSQDGILDRKHQPSENDPMGSLSVMQKIAPHATISYTFFISWHFPNRLSWSGKDVVGNYYTQTRTDAWDAITQFVPQLPVLEKQTLDFVNAIATSNIPSEIKEASLFNLNVLRSQTVFRIPDGHLMGWEGVMDNFGSCMGSCTHVWNYEVTTPFLFGTLAQGMRDAELNYATDSTGKMSFRTDLPLSQGKRYNQAAADGQMGCIMKAYREWQLSGDDEWLKKNYPQVKKALQFAWRKGSWDQDQDGVMEGCQHNTMDVNYYGPNPQMGFWYLGALHTASLMADYLKDKPFAEKCKKLEKQGSRWMDNHLFNGEYYIQKITDPKTFKFLPDTGRVSIPPFQLGKACLIDQLVGQYMAHIVNIGYLANPEYTKTTLRNIMKYNWKNDFSDHFNNMRSYAMGKEQGLLMASWPNGRLEIPFPYFAEVMTGFEYTAATGMIYEGDTENGLKVIRAIRDRHDGLKRNPFSEPECGHHYARSMAAWSSLLAYTQFHYSGVTQSMEITAQPGQYFWSNGYAYGICKVEDSQVEITVLKGKLALKKFALSDQRNVKLKNFILNENESQIIKFKAR